MNSCSAATRQMFYLRLLSHGRFPGFKIPRWQPSLAASRSLRGGAVHRWRERYLFRVNAPSVITTKGSLATYGAMVRRSVIIEVGNYNQQLRHTEDADLGSRLLSKGYKVVFDPALEAISIATNSLAQVLERYWRWHAGPKENVSCADYTKAIWYSMRAMMPVYLRERDLTAAGISFFAPHYQFWRSVLRRRKRH